MRPIINISLPANLKKDVSLAIKNGGFSTTSEFFRALLNLWKEEQLLKQIYDSQFEISRGKGKILKSLKQLR